MPNCDNCGLHHALHLSSKENLCCECYVLAGNPPADWHPRCMKVFREMKAGKSLVDSAIRPISKPTHKGDA